MRLFFINILVLLSIISTTGQIYNQGEIILRNNAKIRTNREITIYSTGKIDNSGKILMKGNWINFNKTGVFTEKKGEVLFNGVSQSIKENPTEFGILTFNNTNTKLQTNISIEEKIVLDSGILELNGYTLELKNKKPSSIKINSGNIISENPNSRIIWNIDNSSEKYIIPFSTKANEQIHLVFTVLDNSSGSVSFNTYATDSTNHPFPEGINDLNYNNEDISNFVIDRFWYFDTNGSKLEVKMSFASNDIEGNQINKNDLSLLYYNGTEWIRDTTGSYDGDNRNSYSTVINESGWFTLFSNPSVHTDDKSNLLKIDALSIYPNPASNSISFKLPNIGKIYSVEIRDLLGRKVLSSFINNGKYVNKLDISNLKKSTYFIIAKQGETKCCYGKFMKI